MEFLPSAASMQERCVKLCLESGAGDVLWLIFPSTEEWGRSSAGPGVLDQKQTLQGPAEQQRIALQAGVKVQLAAGDPISSEYEKAGEEGRRAGFEACARSRGCSSGMARSSPSLRAAPTSPRVVVPTGSAVVV